MEKIIAQSLASHKDEIQVKLCGVTPEIASMAWPVNTRLTAIEQSQEMIEEVWPQNLATRGKVIQGVWLEQHNESGKYGVVIGDGCFISMNYPDGYNALAATLARSLQKGGIFIMRFFIQIEQRETDAQVFEDLMAGKIGSFHAFKWRLAMSLQQSSHQGVCLHDVFHAWTQSGIDEDRLLTKMSWSRATLNTIELYENKKNIFSFATLPELDGIFSKYFHRESIHFPSYELGERCPIIVLRPRHTDVV